jgi:cytochrome c
VNGGIRRIFLDKVNGEYQGAVFAFTGGLEAGPNRMVWGPDGYLYVGMCGQGAPDWAYKKDFGLQKIKANGTDVFEMVSVRSRAGGLEIEYTHEVNAAGQAAGAYNVRSWHYEPTSAYGGPAVDIKTLAVGAVRVSPDKKAVFLPIAGLAAGTLVDIKLTGVASASGIANWTSETWYTLNNLGTTAAFEPTSKLAAPASAAQTDGLALRISAGRLELASVLGGIAGAQVRDTRGILIAEAAGSGGRTLEVPTAGWAPGVYLVSVRSGAKTLQRAVAVP